MALKDAKTKFIVEEALNLLLERSVSEVTIRDISMYADVSEATIYRYFSTKQNLVCAAAAKLEKEIFEQYIRLDRAQKGWERLALFYRSYLTIFTEHREFFKFINEFDAYMLGEGKTDSAEYSSGLELFKTVCSAAYEQGLADGSICAVADWETFYYATTHALLELCKKLSSPDIVKQDATLRKEEEIATLTELILYKLKNA